MHKHLHTLACSVPGFDQTDVIVVLIRAVPTGRPFLIVKWLVLLDYEPVAGDPYRPEVRENHLGTRLKDKNTYMSSFL